MAYPPQQTCPNLTYDTESDPQGPRQVLIASIHFLPSLINIITSIPPLSVSDVNKVSVVFTVPPRRSTLKFSVNPNSPYKLSGNEFEQADELGENLNLEQVNLTLLLFAMKTQIASDDPAPSRLIKYLIVGRYSGWDTEGIYREMMSAVRNTTGCQHEASNLVITTELIYVEDFLKSLTTQIGLEL